MDFPYTDTLKYALRLLPGMDCPLYIHIEILT